MFNTKEEIEKLEKKIQKYSQRRNEIESANYIIAMQIKEIKDGKLMSIEDILKWDFDMLNVGEIVNQIQK